LTLRTLTCRAVQASEERQLEYVEWMRRQGVRSNQMPFLDEVHRGSKAHRRRRGWVRTGTKYPKAYAFFVKAEPTSIIAAFNLDGFVMSAIGAFTGGETVTGEKFARYFRDKIGPILGKFDACERNSIVMLDNASIHKREDVLPVIKDVCRAAGALLRFLPPHCPWYNPIELGFAKFKHSLKSGAQRLDFDTHEHMLAAFSSVTEEDAAAFFRGSGYDAPSPAKKRKRELVAVAVICMMCCTIDDM